MLSMEHRCRHLQVSRVFVFDSFWAVLMLVFRFAAFNNKGIPLEASFSPDSQFIFAGSTDSRINMWNADTGFKVCALQGDHPGPIQCVQFNPKYMMLASACTNMAFWLPTAEDV